MWTGGKPPRIPMAASAPQSSSNKSPNTVMVNKERNVELEALKQRGLAKILNKHFTETTTRLAQEKAAADAAIADLEARKAATSEFHASPGELSPIDAMRVRANQWRAECRRKERETLLLYQRYVHKFGDTGEVALPKNSSSSSSSSTPRNSKQPKSWVPKATPDTATTSAPPPLNAPVKRPAPMGTQVPDMAAQIETTLEEYLKQGALSKPSVQVLGKDETFQTKALKEEAEFRAFYRRRLEERGVDARASDKTLIEREAYDYTNKKGFTPVELPEIIDPFQRNVSGDWIDSAMATVEANLPCNTILEDLDEDDRSVVSGLTTLHSAMTREVLQDCEQSVADFLQEEQDNIRKIMEAQGDDEDGSASDHHAEVDLANKASKEAESMVQKMEEILKEYQAKHGSPENQEIATADAASRGSRPFPTDNPDENWMVYYDEFYQQEYYHEKNSNRTQWEPPSTASTATATGHARGDSSFSSGNSPSAASVAELFSHTEVMPEMSSGSYENRIAKYRRKRRRARRRKLVLIALLCVAVAAGYLVLQHREGMMREEGPLAALQKQINRWLGREDKELLLRLEQEEQERQERARREQEEEAARKRAEEAEAERQKMLHRPWFCNIPFSYLVHGRCRRLANDNPVFDLQSLVTMMLQ